MTHYGKSFCGVAGLGLPKSNAFLTVVPEESVFFEHILDIEIFFFRHRFLSLPPFPLLYKLLFDFFFFHIDCSYGSWVIGENATSILYNFYYCYYFNDVKSAHAFKFK